MNKLLLSLALLSLPLTANAALSDRLSAEDERRMTQETPYRMECPYNEDTGYHDCGVLGAAPAAGDYLPALVAEPHSAADIVRLAGLGAVATPCRKTGKNTSLCTANNPGASEVYEALKAIFP